MKTFLHDLSCSVVLDGEMLVWDPVSERNLPFGTLKTAALGSYIYVVIKDSRPLTFIWFKDKSRKDYNPRPCCEQIRL